MADAVPNGDLRQAVDRLEEGGARARTWIDGVREESSSVSNQADSLIETTRRARLAARRTGGAVHRRNCVGVFGPSQAGKSYLVSALARRKDQPLKIDFSGDVRDFLKEINPAGDRESTGLVSRFTRHATEPDSEYPVELRLLSETDLVKIIANSFLCDFDPNNMSIEPPDEQEIRETIRESESAMLGAGSAARHLDEIELFDLGEYFHRHFRNRIGALDRADYWNAVIRTAARLPVARRARLFSMLWGGLEPLTDLFVSLATALERIGHAPEARVSISGLIPRETDDPPRPNTIIDVAVLNRLNSAEDARDTVALKPFGPDGPGQPTEASARDAHGADCGGEAGDGRCAVAVLRAHGPAGFPRRAIPAQAHQSAGGSGRRRAADSRALPPRQDRLPVPALHRRAGAVRHVAVHAAERAGGQGPRRHGALVDRDDARQDPGVASRPHRQRAVPGADQVRPGVSG